MLAQLTQEFFDLLFAAKEQAGIFLAEGEQAAIWAERLPQRAGVSGRVPANTA